MTSFVEAAEILQFAMVYSMQLSIYNTSWHHCILGPYQAQGM